MLNPRLGGEALHAPLTSKVRLDQSELELGAKPSIRRSHDSSERPDSKVKPSAPLCPALGVHSTPRKCTISIVVDNQAHRAREYKRRVHVHQYVNVIRHHLNPAQVPSRSLAISRRSSSDALRRRRPIPRVDTLGTTPHDRCIATRRCGHWADLHLRRLADIGIPDGGYTRLTSRRMNPGALRRFPVKVRELFVSEATKRGCTTSPSLEESVRSQPGSP